MRKVLGLSGGGTRIVGIGAAALSLLKRGWKPSAITGVSAGAYLALPLALGKYDETEALLDEITKDILSVMFDPSPVKRNGKLSASAIWNAVSGKPYLGKQEKSLGAVRRIVSADEFNAWATDPDTPEVWVLSIDLISGGRVFENLKNHPYETALRLVLASGSIPVYVEAVEVQIGTKRCLLVDGGVRSHIACREILEQYPDGIEEMISIYSRPQDYKEEKSPDWTLADISTPLFRFVDIAGIENSKACEWGELITCQQRAIKLHQVFMPSIIKSPYDSDPGRLAQLKQAAIRAANEVIIRNGTLI